MPVQPPKPVFTRMPIGDGRRPMRPGSPVRQRPVTPGSPQPAKPVVRTAAPLPANSRFVIDITERDKMLAGGQAIIDAIAQGDTPTVCVPAELLGDLRTWLDGSIGRRQLTEAQSLSVLIKLLPGTPSVAEVPVSTVPITNGEGIGEKAVRERMSLSQPPVPTPVPAKASDMANPGGAIAIMPPTAKASDMANPIPAISVFDASEQD